METMRSTWTDERLDDLANRMDRGFERVDDELKVLGGRIDALGSEMNARFDSLNRTIIRFAGAWVVSSGAVIVAFMLSHS